MSADKTQEEGRKEPKTHVSGLVPLDDAQGNGRVRVYLANEGQVELVNQVLRRNNRCGHEIGPIVKTRFQNMLQGEGISAPPPHFAVIGRTVSVRCSHWTTGATHRLDLRSRSPR
jgi:hypothetical protein